MKPLFEEQVIPYLRGRQEDILYSHMVKICESERALWRQRSWI